VRAHACTNFGVSNLSRDIRALSRDVAVLRAELEQYRMELREVLDRFLEECSYGRARPHRDLGRPSSTSVSGCHCLGLPRR
jgi:hypothetical protein